MKTLKTISILLTVLISSLISTTSCTKDDDNTVPDKGEAILLVTFGSSYDLPISTYNYIESKFRSSYPDVEIRWTFTSYIIRNIWSNRGVNYDSPIDALRNLKKEGYSTIHAQSLHIIPGKEYNEVKDTIEYFNRTENMHVTYGTPLLYSDNDINEVADILINKYKTELDSGKSVVLMGHGTDHSANDRYQRIQDAIKAKTDKNLFVGTVEATPSLDDVISKLNQVTKKDVILTPLMSVAGNHATRDMAGGYPEQDPKYYSTSWNGQITDLGYNVSIIMKGLGDYEDIVNIWLKHFEESKQ